MYAPLTSGRLAVSGCNAATVNDAELHCASGITVAGATLMPTPDVGWTLDTSYVQPPAMHANNSNPTYPPLPRPCTPSALRPVLAPPALPVQM